MLTPQEVFDKVAHHLLKQKARSMISSSTGGSQLCGYRGGNGLCCAVGFLIPEELYDVNMEGNGICDMSDGANLLRKVLHDSGIDVPVDVDRDSEHYDDWDDRVHSDATPTLSILKELQELHDSRPIEGWLIGLKGIATDYGLEFKETQYV